MNVHAGSCLDPLEYQGLAHFCEHMLFMGTKKYPSENDFSEFISNHAGNDNAFTSEKDTNYTFEIQN